jgi:flagellar hook-associated protein 1 FlgK
MSLSQAIATSVAGLRTTQAGLALVAANVANADTPGYVKKSVVPVSVSAGQAGISVRVGEIQRQLDKYVQRSLRTETSGAAYASLRSDFYQQVQTIYGAPGSSTTLESLFNNFTSSLQALTTSPDDQAARSNVLATAQVLTQQLNTSTQSIQSLRSDAELGLSDSVSKANDAITQIASINAQLSGLHANDTAAATLLDQRDNYINQLSQLMDVNVVEGDLNQIRVFTTSGIQLVGTTHATLQFDAQGTIGAENQWSADPNKRSVGTVTLIGTDGSKIDLVANNSLRSGQIAGYLQLRDRDLPQAQSQLDAFAAAMASSLSDVTTPGTAVTSGAQAGFGLDTAGLLNGNTISVSYVDRSSGKTQKLTFVRVDDATALPLADTASNDPNDKVIGLNFSGGLSSVVTQMNQALVTRGLSASNPSGSTLQIIDDGSGRSTVSAASTTTTATGFGDGSQELPFFTDDSGLYSGAITSLGPQSLGLAGRISVNAALLGDPGKLVNYQPGTTSGDPTRPNFILNQLTTSSRSFSPDTGIGTADAPFTSTIGSFLRQIISNQGQAADNAKSLSDGQQVVLTSLQTRFNDTSGVSVDEEMANLLQLQNSYAANARVLSAVKDMIDTLMNSGR